MSKLKEKLGKEKFEKIIEIIKDTDIKETDFDLLEGYIPRQRLNEVTEKLKATEETNKTLVSQSEETKKLLSESEKFKTESEEYKKKYADLETKHTTELENKNKEVSNVLKRSLVKEKLINEGAKHPNLLMKEIDFDKVSIENDKLTNFDDTFKSLNENYKDLFTVKQNTQNVETGGTGGGNPEFSEDELTFLDNIKS